MIKATVTIREVVMASSDPNVKPTTRDRDLVVHVRDGAKASEIRHIVKATVPGNVAIKRVVLG